MYLSPERIKELISKFLEQSLTPEEAQELENWRQKDARNDETFFEATSPEQIRNNLRLINLHSVYTEQVLAKVTGNTARAPKSFHIAWKRFAAAAVIIFMIFGVAYFFNSSNSTRQTKLQPQELVDRMPGGDNARVVLSSGVVIDLKNAKEGVIATDGDAQLIKTEEGKLIYKTARSSGTVKINRVETPAGGQFPIELPDGTKVFMNSVSSISFPTAFLEKDRVIEFSGEGYFEVARDINHPFKIMLNGHMIEVLGTHFSVNAYKDEPIATTTLVEGSIKVTEISQANSPVTFTVKPGQAASYNNSTHQIKLMKDVDVESALAWKNGKFDLKSADLGTVLRQLARWYDVTVEFEKGMPDVVISGTIDKKLTLQQTIKVLKVLGVNARLENGKLIVAK